MTAPDGFPFVYVHSSCGKPAFYLKHMPSYGETLRSDIVADLDGDEVPAYSQCVCGSCGEFIPSPQTENITRIQ